MTSDEGKRPYRKRRRARQEVATRRRITEAVMELHRTVGPARTRVSEVAELAGVSRRTVYNHFPTEGDLIASCSAHWAAQNPFPDPAAWEGIEDPGERLRAGLKALYGWYAGTRDMMGNVLRDAPLVEPLAGVVDAAWRPYLESLVDRFAAGWRVAMEERPALRAALRTAVDFRTWELLSGGVREDGASLAARMVTRAFGR